ncbi:hypothetical protein [Clavibacter michiganensis]|uniref:hypothetical protein n=1 Tax=Clavibacter michiganensis TaxID=28447 RepID=UPI00292F740F|nr:hypothetical protein [Clavibacter michiganensis]
MDTTHRSTSAAPTRGRRPLRLAATVGALALALAIPLAEGATRRTLVLAVQMRRGPGVIRVAEGPADARLNVHSLRVTRIHPGEEADEGVPTPPTTGTLVAEDAVQADAA